MLTSINDCSGTINRTTTDFLNSTNAITWTHTDDNNNSTSQIQIIIVSCETNGINELSALIFEVYPNRTDGIVIITNTNSL